MFFNRVTVTAWFGAMLLGTSLAAVAAPAAQIPASAAQTPAPKVPATMMVQMRYEARTVSKSLKQGTVNAGGMQWQCAGSRCTASQPAGTAESACRALARQVGAIASFVFGAKTLSSAELAQCRTAVGTGAHQQKSSAPAQAPAAQIDPAKAQQAQAPGALPQVQSSAIKPEPADLLVYSMSLTGRKVALAVHGNAATNGQTASLELLDAQSNWRLWSGSVRIGPLFGKYGAVVVADYEIPRGRRQQLKARITNADGNPQNNELVKTLGQAGAPMYVERGVVTAQIPNRLELAVGRKGPDWIEVIVTAIVAAEYGELRVNPIGVRNARCTSGSGASSASDGPLLVTKGSRRLRFLCSAEPQTANGSVNATLAIERRVVDTKTTPWNVTPPSGGSGSPVVSDLTIVRGGLEIIDEKPGRFWVRIRNNGPERVYQIFTVGWFAYGSPPAGQLVAQGEKRQAFNLASGEETTVTFDLRAHRSVRGRPLTWTRAAGGYHTNIGVIVDADGDLFESNEDNNRLFVPVTHPTFGNFVIGEGSG